MLKSLSIYKLQKYITKEKAEGFLIFYKEINFFKLMLLSEREIKTLAYPISDNGKLFYVDDFVPSIKRVDALCFNKINQIITKILLLVCLKNNKQANQNSSM